MAPLFVVLDANVLFPLYLREVLLQLASEGIFSPVWSQSILNEATKNLVKEKRMTRDQSAKFEWVLNELYPEAMTEVPAEVIEKMTNHPKDRHVLATAVVSRAEIIVTDNLKDFQSKDLSYWNVTAQSPEEFLTDLYDLYPEEVIRTLNRISERLKDKTLDRNPPLGLDKLLASLDKTVPEFSNNIKFHEIKWRISACVNRALIKFGRKQASNRRFLEGDRYKIMQNKSDISIFSKGDSRDILFHQNRHIKSRLTQDDVDVFLKFQEELNLILFESSFRLQK